ncbi:MAG: S8 family peptidase [Limisphaerales bacterium]
MKFRNRIEHLTGAILVCLLFVSPAIPAEHLLYKGRRVHPSLILVQLKPGQTATSKAMSTALDECQSKVVDRFRNLPGLMLLDTRQLPGGGKALRKKGIVPAALPSLADRIRVLEKCGLFEFVEPDFVRTASATPNDAAFVDSRLWGLQNTGQNGGSAGADVNAAGAWDLTTGSRDVIVGVIDTGIRYTHNDLAAQMWRNEDEIPGNQVDDDNDGYVDNVFGINAVTGAANPGDPMDDNGHGTHVAGTIGAAANNGHPHVGVAWEVKLMALKFLDSEGSGKTSDEIKCIDFAIANGVDVINASYGGYGFSSAQEAAMARAEQAGIMFVAAAGNESNNNDNDPSFPASFPHENVISVAAIDRHDNLAGFSNFGANAVDVAAPGVDIFSCWIGSDSDYKSISGTSMASPHVAGVAALIRARFPNIGISEQRALLLNTVTTTPALAGKVASGGRVNAQAGVNAQADGELETVVTPASGAELLAGSTLAIRLRITDLHDVTDATIVGTANGQPAPAFINDGTGPDDDANDAIYTAEMIVPSFEQQLAFDLDISAPGKQNRNLQFNYPIAQPAPNNNFSKATIIDTNSMSLTGSNRRSDSEPGEPQHANVGGGNTVWWQWVAPSNGVVNITTSGSDFDTVLAVYTGTSVSSLTQVAANDDVAGNDTTSIVSFDATTGTAYAIVVDGYQSSVGDIVLNLGSTINNTGAPANDNFTDAIALTGNSANAVEPEIGNATKETNEPNHAGNAGGNSIWSSGRLPTTACSPRARSAAPSTPC